MANNQSFDSIVKANSFIAADWYDGYKLELTFTAKLDVDNWQLDFELPYGINKDEVYGVDLVDRGNGRYTVSGIGNQTSLKQGQSISSVFIVRDDNKNNQQGILPKFNSVIDRSDAVYSPPINIVEPEFMPVKIAAIESVDDGRILSVDYDFGGNIQNAIAAAKDGDTVQLGNRTYYTADIYLDKDITLDGQLGSVINGGNTSRAVIKIAPGASGATIQDLRITNANNGIYGYGAENLTLQNLQIDNIGIDGINRYGQNNTGIVLNHTDGLQLLNSTFDNISKTAVSIGDTEVALISNIEVKNINLAAEHVQSHSAAGIKFFNTNNIILKDSSFFDINANHIWNDTTTNTTIENNFIERVGEDFLKPLFNTNVEVTGIYNEKSHNSIVRDNQVYAEEGFTAYRATEFTTETMTLDNNYFSSMELGSTDYWVNESIEKLIAITESADEANFSLFASEYNAQANIG